MDFDEWWYGQEFNEACYSAGRQAWDYQQQRIAELEGRQSKMKILEFNGYGPTAPRVYLPAQNIISFHLIDFNGNYGTHIDLPEWRYIRVGAYPEEVKKKLEAALLPGGGE